MVEILEGISLDEQVVVAGHAALKEQSLVNVVSDVLQLITRTSLS
ncbi:hypothetical protein [Alishewanella longhuensis]